MSVGQMAVALWAINAHLYDGVEVKDALRIEKEFLELVETSEPMLINAITVNGVMSERVESELQQLLQDFRQSFAQSKENSSVSEGK